MRPIFIIIFFYFSCLSFGQDSLKIDTTLKPFTPATHDKSLTDSSTLNTIPTKNKKQKKKVHKSKIKEDIIDSKVDNTENIDNIRKDNILKIAGILIVVVVIILLVFSHTNSASPAKKSISSSIENEYVSDYLSRIFLSRRDYYRNVYLKSEAWKRKRYVVLKRDKWRCVYCGGRATQVHHTKYAKWNIGKEPIEWLVSICKSCHDSKH
jgi:hypothetical protein